MHDLAYQFASNLKATWRYRWLAVVLAWIIALGAWAQIYRMPDRYEASARVWVDTQSVLKHLLAGLTAQPNVDQLVGMMSRTLISRPNMERVIGMTGMGVELKSSAELELLVTHLTREVKMLSAGGANLFTLTYTNKDPRLAKQVVQSLLTIFVEESVSDQRKDSEAAQRFIDVQIDAARQKMDAAEKAVIDFKRQQLLRAGGRGDHGLLLNAETALNEATLELKLAESSRDTIKRNQADEMEIPSLLVDRGAGTGGDPEIDARVRALEQKLDALRLNYTEQHPDVVALVRTIAELKDRAKAQGRQGRPSPSAAQPLAAAPRPLTLSLAKAEEHVAAARARVEEYRKRYNELKAAAIAAPQIDADLAQLTREYDLSKSTYGALLARRETARMSREMETGMSVKDFRVIDPPRVPSLPHAPNRLLLNSLALLVALAGGIGSAFVLSQIRPTFNDERRLRAVSGLRVLGTVVMAWTEAQKARRSRGLVALLASFVGLISVYVLIMTGLVQTALTALRT